MSRIKDIHGRQISDSRGNPTVEARVTLESGICGWAAVPSGASTGTREAVELRDGDRMVYRGKSVLRAVGNVNTTINLALRRQQINNQRKIDEIMLELDGTKSKKHLGANAILAVSLATADAASKELLGEERLFDYISRLYDGKSAVTLPVPMINVINGGRHADNRLCIQEFMIMPVGAESIWESLKIGSRIFQALDVLIERIPDNPAVGIGDEGGYSPMLCRGKPQEYKVRAALDLVMDAMSMVDLQPGTDIVLALDVAASEFYDERKKLYHFCADDESREVLWSSNEMISLYESLLADYPIYSIEDGLSEKDSDGWVLMTKELGRRIQLVGDDLFVTNPQIFSAGIKKGMANSILVKVNQIGSLSETLDTISLAERNQYTCVISHRSGETLDTKIADIVVGCNTGQIKTGSMSRGERISKYNRLKDIEIMLGTSARFPGANVFSRYER